VCEKTMLLKSLSERATLYRWEYGDEFVGFEKDLTIPFVDVDTLPIKLMVTDALGCSHSKKMDYIFSDKNKYILGIPSAFSPNGDGVNELFEVKGSASHCVVEVEVFNRWGVRYFHTKNYLESWNGKYKNDVAPEGVYVYIITCKNNIKQVGTVTLLK